MESEDRKFFQRVRDGYIKRALSDSRYRILDASRSLDMVATELKAQLSTFVDENV